jgi:hypothetical protein
LTAVRIDQRRDDLDVTAIRAEITSNRAAARPPERLFTNYDRAIVA